MTTGIILFFIFLLSGFSSAHAAGACGPALLTVANCPLMEVDGAGDPVLKDFNAPLPIGRIKIPEKVYFFSGPLCIAESSIRTTMQSLYAVFSDAFLKPFIAALTLYVLVYAISFMYGLVNPKDFAVRLLKLAIVYALVTDNCTFYTYLYGGFIGVSNDLIQIMSEVDPDPGATPPANAGEAQKQLYKSLDDLFQNVVGVEGLIGLGIFLLSSLTSNAQGIPSALLATLGIGSMAIAMMRAMVTLGIAMAGIAFFLLFTPMFLSFYLFENTKRFFDNWLSMLISFTLQPLIIFAFLVMMKTVLSSVSGAPTAAQQMNINQVITHALDGISSYRFEPEMAEGRPTFNIPQPDKDKIAAIAASLNITILPDDKELDIQRKFFMAFASKLLFWFAMNMIMAAFIKEVPGLAHRLGGYVSAPALGASGGHGISLPGVDGTSGQITSILKASMLKKTGIRNAGIAGLSIATAYGVKNMVSDGMQARDNNIKNQAADGEADRKGGISRAGTLGELLGMDKTTRDGTRIDGIGEKAAAVREGPNIVGIGEKDGAARIDTTAASMKAANENAIEQQPAKAQKTTHEQAVAKAAEQQLEIAKAVEKQEALNAAIAQQQNAANKNAQKGADMLSAMGVTINAPRLHEKPTVIRDINIKVQDIDIAAMSDKKTTYLLNNQKIEVKKGEEEKFLRQQIAQIEKDMQKANVLGGRASQEIAASMTLRERLMMRLEAINPKNTLAAAEKAEERQRLMTELGVVSSENQAIASMQKQYGELEKQIAMQKVLLDAAKATKQTPETKKDIADILAQIAAMEQQRTALRSTATILPELVEQRDIEALKKLADQKDMLSFKEDLDKLHDSMLRLDVVMAHKNATAEMAKVVEDLRLEKLSPDEIKDVAKQVDVIMSQPVVANVMPAGVIAQKPVTPSTAAQLDKLIAQLKNSSKAAQYKKAIEELEKLQTAQEKQVFERRRGIDGSDVGEKIVEKAPEKEATGSLDNFAKAMRESVKNTVTDYQAANSQDKRVGEVMGILDKLNNIGASAEKNTAFTDVEVDRMLTDEKLVAHTEDGVDGDHPHINAQHKQHPNSGRQSKKQGAPVVNGEFLDEAEELLAAAKQKETEEVEIQKEDDQDAQEKLAEAEYDRKKAEEEALAQNNLRTDIAQEFENKITVPEDVVSAPAETESTVAATDTPPVEDVTTPPEEAAVAATETTQATESEQHVEYVANNFEATTPEEQLAQNITSEPETATKHEEEPAIIDQDTEEASEPEVVASQPAEEGRVANITPNFEAEAPVVAMSDEISTITEELSQENSSIIPEVVSDEPSIEIANYDVEEIQPIAENKSAETSTNIEDMVASSDGDNTYTPTAEVVEQIEKGEPEASPEIEIATLSEKGVAEGIETTESMPKDKTEEMIAATEDVTPSTFAAEEPAVAAIEPQATEEPVVTAATEEVHPPEVEIAATEDSNTEEKPSVDKEIELAEATPADVKEKDTFGTENVVASTDENTSPQNEDSEEGDSKPNKPDSDNIA